MITDASLSTSGALSFTVDVTEQLQDLLDGGATHIGLVFATADSPTGTSLDNLGVSGAAMPSIAVTTVVHELPNFDDAQRLCQKTIGKQARVLANFALVQLQNCFTRIVKDVALGKDLPPATAFCAKALDIGASPPSKIDKKRAVATQKILDKCGSPLSPPSIGSPCDPLAANFTDTAGCIVDQHLEQVQEMLRAEFADACGIAVAAGIVGDYPLLCSAP